MNNNRISSVRVMSAAFQRRLESDPEPAVKKFFKIICLSTIKEKMMKIPARFVRLGPKLTDTVNVETPVGFKRSIGIKRMGDEVWFNDGWSEFANAHSLSEGHFLLFHYTGNSSFRVMIFGVSASEIKYPLDKVHVTGSDDDGVVEVMNGEDKQGLTDSSGSSDHDSSEGEDLLKKKPSVGNIKSEYVTTDNGVEESDSMDEDNRT